MSPGVFMAVSIPSQETAIAAVITSAMTADSHTPPVTYRRSSWLLPAPNCWATGMANPAHTPQQKPTTRKLMDPVEPTAARAAPPSVFPTMAVSTTLYSCWNRYPSRTGMPKLRIWGMGRPFVRSFVIVNHLTDRIAVRFPHASSRGTLWKLTLIIVDFHKKASVNLCKITEGERIRLVQCDT
jgi:hypothetical protein